MKAKQFIGISLVLAVLLGLGIFVSVVSSSAEAYNGPGGRGGWSQTPQATPGTGTGMQYGNGYGMGSGGQCGTCTGQGMGQMRGPGGPRNGMGQGTGQYSTPLSEAGVKALDEAIQEEYLARATYQSIVDKFGQALPFANILRSEKQHLAALARQYTAHGLAVPGDTWAGKVTAPATLKDAFSAAIQLEKDDGALMDRLFQSVTEPELARVFTQLQRASLNMHLTALKYYNK